MAAKYIFAVLAVGFAVAAGWRWLRSRGRGLRIDAASRTWWLLAVIFGAVSAWLQWPTS